MIRTVVLALFTNASMVASLTYAADLPGEVGSFGCLPKPAVSSLLPVEGYSDAKRLGEQKGVTYFDAKKGGSWFRVGVNTCTAIIQTTTREKAPA